MADTGPRIVPEHWDTIFDSFTQVDQSRTPREGGTGLGLTVSRRFCALLGGEVPVESTPRQGRHPHRAAPAPLTEARVESSRGEAETRRDSGVSPRLRVSA